MCRSVRVIKAIAIDAVFTVIGHFHVIVQSPRAAVLGRAVYHGDRHGLTGTVNAADRLNAHQIAGDRVHRGAAVASRCHRCIRPIVLDAVHEAIGNEHIGRCAGVIGIIANIAVDRSQRARLQHQSVIVAVSRMPIGDQCGDVINILSHAVFRHGIGLRIRVVGGLIVPGEGAFVPPLRDAVQIDQFIGIMRVVVSAIIHIQLCGNNARRDRRDAFRQCHLDIAAVFLRLTVIQHRAGIQICRVAVIPIRQARIHICRLNACRGQVGNNRGIQHNGICPLLLLQPEKRRTQRIPIPAAHGCECDRHTVAAGILCIYHIRCCNDKHRIIGIFFIKAHGLIGAQRCLQAVRLQEKGVFRLRFRFSVQHNTFLQCRTAQFILQGGIPAHRGIGHDGFALRKRRCFHVRIRKLICLCTLHRQPCKGACRLLQVKCQNMPFVAHTHTVFGAHRRGQRHLQCVCRIDIASLSVFIRLQCQRVVNILICAVFLIMDGIGVYRRRVRAVRTAVCLCIHSALGNVLFHDMYRIVGYTFRFRRNGHCRFRRFLCQYNGSCLQQHSHCQYPHKRSKNAFFHAYFPRFVDIYNSL